MSGTLAVSVGQCSRAGRKEQNQDFHGAFVPEDPLLGRKGVAIALADGISSSAVSREASESAVKSFLEDYYCTSDAWSVKTAAHRVLQATNSWLHAQTRRSRYRYERDRGYVCTFSGLIIKSNTAHVFHVGDARVLHLRGRQLEQLTRDHRVTVAQDETYLARALGIDPHLEVEYRAVPLEAGDIFVLLTDGVHEHLDDGRLGHIVTTAGSGLDAAAAALVDAAFEAGSEDNLTVQIVRIDALPDLNAGEIQRQAAELALPPLLEPRMHFDGFEIVRQIHANSRSHIFLARDEESGELLALKIPSLDMRDDPAYRERFLMEEWIARRIDNPHVLKPHRRAHAPRYLYVVMEYLEGQTLTQWMRDNPAPDLPTVRRIVEQIARGLRAFHRREMLHQDLRPDNVMIDRNGTVKIIDFGSTRVAGMADGGPVRLAGDADILGTVQYTAPEYFLGEAATPRSDLFSLAVITYQMLTGRLPYGAEAARATTRSAQHRLSYRSALDDRRAIPAWVDEALRKAVHPLPHRRHEALSEFITDLNRPNPAFLGRARPPLLERHRVAFWKGLSFALSLVVLGLIGYIRSQR